MGQVNAHQTYQAVTLDGSHREDLSDVIYNISPTVTPFLANAQKAKASALKHEWTIDNLAAADTDNAEVEGFDFPTADPTGDDTKSPDRRGNHLQTSSKVLKISRIADIVDKAGRQSAVAYQIAKKGKELKRDLEAIITSNQAGTAMGSATAGRSASLNAWITTNDDFGTGGASPALTSGIPETQRTSGTDRALTQSLILAGVKGAYDQGGDPNMIMVSTTMKQALSTFWFTSASSRIATPYQDHGKTPRGGVQAVGAVDAIVTDFGVLDIVPNRFQRDDDVWILDMEMWAIAYLEGYKIQKMGKAGDNVRHILTVDWTLEARNEAASAVVLDVDETLAVAA